MSMGMWIGIAVVLIVAWVILKPSKKEDSSAVATKTSGAQASKDSTNDAIIVATAAAIAAREDEIVALITAALAFHGLSGGSRIVAVRPLGNKEWKFDARSSVVHGREQMF